LTGAASPPRPASRAGYNATLAGTPASYWLFTSHYGNYDGEDYDDDPGAGPGYLRWDDSYGHIDISGYIYADEAGTPIGDPPCDGFTPVVTLKINGAGDYSASCDAYGYYYISDVHLIGGEMVLTAYLNTNGGKRAVAVFKSPSVDISDLNLYENRVVITYQGIDRVTIDNFDVFDSDQDSDIPFSAVNGSPDTLTIDPDTELHVLAGKEFAPGGNVTINASGSGSPQDGSLHIGEGAIFTSAGTETHSFGGNWTAKSGAVFSAANSTVVFTATTTGKTIATNGQAFYNLYFIGNGGVWTLADDLSVDNDLDITTGTVSGSYNITVSGGDATGNGTISMTNGTFTISGTGNFGGNTNWTFYNLNIGGGITAVTSKIGTNEITVNHELTIADGQALNASSTVWQLNGAGTPFIVNGTLNADRSWFRFMAAADTAVPAADYHWLELAPAASGFPTYTLMAGAFNVAGRLNIGNGVYPVAVAAHLNNPELAVGGDFIISAGAVFTASGLATTTVSASFQNAGVFDANGGTVLLNSGTPGETIDPGASAFHNLRIDNPSGGWTIAGNATTTGDFILANLGTLAFSPGAVITVGGQFANHAGGAATDWTGSTLKLESGTSYTINTKTAGAGSYAALSLGPNTRIRMWDSTSTVYNIGPAASLYSMDHNGADGSLYIFGDYHVTGTDHWDYATDFDGTDLAGSPRPVNVRLAAHASTTVDSGTLNILGAANATTTIQSQDGGSYGLAVTTGGTLNAGYYEIREIGASGLAFTGTPSVSALDHGDYELSQSGGAMISLAASVIDANPGLTIDRCRFATSTGITSGYNVTLAGTPASFWLFTNHYGNYDGEDYDDDGLTECGLIRWDDSVCPTTLEQSHYRVRRDDGAERAWRVKNYSGNMGATASLAVPIDPVAATSSAFILAPSGHMSAGRGSTNYSQNANEVLTRARFSANGQVTLTRGSATNDSYYSFFVIEDISGDEIMVKSGSNSFLNAADADLDIDLGPGIINASNTAVFLTVSTDHAGTTNYHEAHVKGFLTSASNLRLLRTAGVSIVTVDWFVVEFIGAGWTVKQGDFTLTTGTQASPQSQAIPSVDPDNSFVFMNWSADTNGLDTVSAKVELYSADTLRFSRQDTTSGSCFIRWFVINHPELRVERGSDYALATDLTEDQAITAIDLERSFPLTFNDSNQGTGNNARLFPRSYWRAWFSASTALNWDRAYSGEDSNFFWQVIELPHGGATWLADEDTPAAGREKNDNFRLRFTITNTGDSPAANEQFVLQAAPRGVYGSCASVPTLDYSAVATTSEGFVVVADSPHFLNQASTTAQLTATGEFSTGRLVEYPDNRNGRITIDVGGYTEIEYAVKFTDSAVKAENYCFRTARPNYDLDSYARVADVEVINPYVSGYVYDDEGTTVWTGCDGITPNLSVAAGGLFIASTSCSAATGYYELKDVPHNHGEAVSIFLNSNAGNTDRGVSVTVAADHTSDINLNVRRGRVWLTTEGEIEQITNDSLDSCDSDSPAQCADVPYSVLSGNLTVEAEAKLIIAPGKIFSPGGEVVLSAGADPAGPGGDLLISPGAVMDAADNKISVGNDWFNYGLFTRIGQEPIKIGGGWDGSGGAHELAETPVEFTATTTGHYILSAGQAFFALNFNGDGGSWILADNATTTATTTITQGNLIQGDNTVFEVRSLTVMAGAVFTKANINGHLLFEGDGVDGFIEDLNSPLNDLGNVQIGYSPAVTRLNSNFSATSLTINQNDTLFTRGYDVTVTNFITVNGTYNCTDDKAGDGTITTLGTDWTVASGGVFVAAYSTTTFSGANNSTINTGGTDANHAFYHITIEKSSLATATLASYSLKASGKVLIGANSTLDVSANHYDIYAGGDWLNYGRFAARQATTTFDAVATGFSVRVGDSPFYNVIFNNSSGGWTVAEPATSTNDWIILNAAAFTLSAGQTIEVQGEYRINDGVPAATAWQSGAMLYLNNAGAYTIGSKTQSAESYGVLKIGADTDVKMWNSTSTTYSVDATGSLYSQDHNNMNGALYIWGDYRRESGTEYWSRAVDFDGADLAGAERTSQVRLADGASVTIDSADLEILGTAGATTTVANQGGGLYSLNVNNGALNANYYEVRQADTAGLNLSGAVAVTSLDYGDLELAATGGRLITVSSSTVSANPGLTVTGCRFASSTGINSGYNVTLNGIPSSGWYFTGHYGNLAGENFDNDPGDPRGYLVWEDSPDYVPKSQDWQWFHDETDPTPTSSPAAAVNFAPAVDGRSALKLRLTVNETGGMAGENVKLRLQYSTHNDFSYGRQLGRRDRLHYGFMDILRRRRGR
jgi:hypothetical protein